MKKTLKSSKDRIKKSSALDKSIQMDLMEARMFITSFVSFVDFEQQGLNKLSMQKALVEYVKENLSPELIEMSEQEPVNIGMCSVACAEEYKWGQAYLILSVLSRILSNPQTHIWASSEDRHLRTILFKLKVSFGKDDGRSIVGKLFEPIFINMKGDQDAPYRLQVMDAIFKIISHTSYFDKLRFLGFVQETILIDKKLSEAGTGGVGSSRPYILSYKESGLIHKVGMGH